MKQHALVIEWRRVPCPKCGVAAGQGCVTSGGGPAYTHSPRIRASKLKRSRDAAATEAAASMELRFTGPFLR